MERKQAENKNSWFTRVGWLILLIIVLFMAPFGLSEFYLTVLCEALVMSMLALSFNLLFGYMGQLSFGRPLSTDWEAIRWPC
jgi:branched-chain amino acid transport system permease protein